MNVIILLIALLSVVFAGPVDSDVSHLAIPKGTDIPSDVRTMEAKNLNNTGDREAIASCGSVWYLTKCNFYCPCGWYYREDCGTYLCYDITRVGCYGRCPKYAEVRCGGCK